MDQTVAAIIDQIAKLDASQRAELRQSINDFVETGRLNEGVKKEAGMVMGPLGSRCPVCGK